MAKVENSNAASERLEKAITKTRIDIIREFPFMSFLLMNTEIMESSDIPTCAATTVPRNMIFVNENFFLTELKNRKERNFVMIHELLHIFLEHIGRQTDHNYHPKLWNVATDYVINLYINDMGKGSSRGVLSKPENILFDEKYNGMSADQVYHRLLKDAKNNADKAAAAGGADNIGDDGYNGQRPLDEVANEAQTEASKAENRQMVAAGIAQDTTSLKNMGGGAADMLRAFQDLIDPKIPWQSLLRDFVTAASRTHYTYNRISRRSTGAILFPTMEGNHVKMCFGIDTSGSMSGDDLGEAMVELRSICEEFDAWEVDFVTCDTNVHLLGQYDSEEGDDWDCISKNLKGGGGTQMGPMVGYANEMEELPSVCIIITDGYIPEDELDQMVNDVPVIVVVTSEGNYDLKLENCSVVQMKDTTKF
jgi:predicted metal-dependent peptidase